MGPGFKLISPDSNNKYLKNESWFLSFSLESAYNDRFLSSIDILSQKEKNSYEKSYFVSIGCERSLKVGLWFLVTCMMQKHRNRPGFKFKSPDSSNKYLKNESWFRSFSLESIGYFSLFGKKLP